MFRFKLRLSDKTEWVKVFDPRDCTLFVRPKELPALGEPVRIDLEIADSGPRVILRGKVISRRQKSEGSAPAGCSVALGPEEREKINYLNGFVRGGLLNLREKRRLPVRLPVTYGGLEGPCRSFTRDINEEGVFVVAEEPLPEESEVHLLIEFPGEAEPASVAGVVSHTVVVEDDDVPGMGILFTLTPEQRTAFESRVDALEKAFLSGSLPEDTLL